MADGSTDTTKDTLSDETSRQSSTGEGGTSAGTTKTYTQAELDKALADSGRKWKAKAEALEAKTKASEERITDLQKQLDDAEDGHFKDVPDMAAINRMKREMRDERAKLLQEKAEYERQREELATDLKEVEFNRNLKVAKAIATSYKDVDAEELVSLTDGSKERMEALAKRIGKPKEEPKPKIEVPTVKVDSGVTKGGGVDLSKLSPQEKIELGLQKAKNK